MIKLEVELDGLFNEIEDYIRHEVPDTRHEYVLDLMRRVLRLTIQYNPVDTGRSRASWVTGLEQLGGEVPVGWEGSHPESSAIAQGRSSSELEQDQSEHVDEIAASNHVDYINHLEFGTSRFAPRGMVRRALLESMHAVRSGE